MRWFGWIACVILLLGCEAQTDAPPTFERAPSLAPSATVLPIISPEPSDSFTGRSDPTSAALAAEGEPDQAVTVAAQATDTFIPLTIFATDGTRLYADYFGAPSPPAITILFIHSDTGLTPEHDQFVRRLQQGGYNVMQLHLRGYGQSSGLIDWSQLENDIAQTIATLTSLPTVTQFGIWVEGRSTIGAIQVCSQLTDCSFVGVTHPLPDDDRASLGDAALALNSRPLFVGTMADRTISAATAEILSDQALNGNLNLNFDYDNAFDTVLVWLDTTFSTEN